ncbi:ABC-type branched-chain amino acid transport system, substrate-binding protein [Micromonospora pattaloongensis]|uniref:ABC-type branched-chain amino acid transport system, substrate-binding protein n=1 Tax=Micromonospora pattaloongensis TaxID=405436 RepID=A0A1H3QSJ6_9ACTN|nr:ABC transporter substrate-binding protein [Micromonospora pattaloongensis]SDZ16031.1 ABC-type branched-chain amino acid transport system, substrate-binding protein [Micromonospora pattaloongensis]
MHRIARRGLAAAASLALLVGAAACANDEKNAAGNVPGVTDTEIVIGTHQPLTGPAAPGYARISAATKAYFAHLNSKGGVNGRKITYKVMDDGYNPANTENVVRKLILDDKVFAILGGLGTPTHTNVLEFLEGQKVPDLFVASGSRSWNQPDTYPTTFGWQPDYTVEGKILATYVKQAFPGKKVCHFGQNDDFGRDSLLGVEKVLGPVAAKQTYTPTNQQVGPAIGALKAAGCEVIISATIPGFTALAMGQAFGQGLRAQWVVSNVGADYTTLSAQLGDKKAILEGMIGNYYLPMAGDSADPWIREYTKIHQRYNGTNPLDGNAIYGYSMAYTFVQALLAAGQDLTREKLVDAVEKGGFQGPGLTPFRYSADDHSGYSGVRLNRVQGGVQSYFGATYTTDDGDGEVREHTQPPVTPPADAVPAS